MQFEFLHVYTGFLAFNINTLVYLLHYANISQISFTMLNLRAAHFIAKVLSFDKLCFLTCHKHKKALGADSILCFSSSMYSFCRDNISVCVEKIKVTSNLMFLLPSLFNDR